MSVNNVNCELKERIINIHDQFYTENKKNSIFTTEQKRNCREKIIENISQKEIMDAIVYIVPDTNIIMFDYNIFKKTINPGEYDELIEHIFNIYNDMLSKYSQVEIYADLKGLTITSAEKNFSLLGKMYEKIGNPNYFQQIQKLHIFNCPSCMNNPTVFFRFIDPALKESIVFY